MAVADPALVGVDIQGIRLIGQDFRAILQAVEIGVGIQWIGLLVEMLVAVREAIAIGVRIVGIGADDRLVLVEQAIAIAIHIAGAGGHLELGGDILLGAEAIGHAEFRQEGELRVIALRPHDHIAAHRPRIIEVVEQAPARMQSELRSCRSPCRHSRR